MNCTKFIPSVPRSQKIASAFGSLFCQPMLIWLCDTAVAIKLLGARGVPTGDAVGVGVDVGVTVAVAVALGVAVAVGVAEGVPVGVGVGVPESVNGCGYVYGVYPGICVSGKTSRPIATESHWMPTLSPWFCGTGLQLLFHS